MKIKYCSLGHWCHSALLLQDQNLKKESYPFDWVSNSPEMIKDCIADDFKKFLDKKYYSEITEEWENPWDDHKGCQHLYYAPFISHHRDFEKRIIFRHRDPLNNEEDYKYFERCVYRFRELLASNEEKIFLLMYPNRNNSSLETMENALSLCNFLKGYTTNFKLIAIHQHIEKNNAHELIINGNLTFVDLSTISEDAGGKFFSNADNKYLNDLFKQLIYGNS